MRWVPRLASRWKDPERQVWFGVAAWAAIIVAFAVAACAGYSAVVFAHTTVALTPSRAVRFEGTTGSGVLLDNGSVRLTIRLTVHNPSSRPLAFASIAYQSWIEDVPADAGLAGLGRTDQILVNGTGTHRFFKAFLGSFAVADTRIPAEADRTIEFSFNLTRASAAARFNAVQNITDYTSHVRGEGTSVSWVHWVQVALSFPDIPPPGPTATYLVDLTRIVLEEGPNLG